ncbi:MAG: hypothetical protein LBF02_00680 [Mycoplasmataceae bacterium]|jgi:hypothetical protein|nr:hypothetical protein [Mycoplasmataceae bacterium]
MATKKINSTKKIVEDVQSAEQIKILKKGKEGRVKSIKGEKIILDINNVKVDDEPNGFFDIHPGKGTAIIVTIFIVLFGIGLLLGWFGSSFF